MSTEDTPPLRAYASTPERAAVIRAHIAELTSEANWPVFGTGKAAELQNLLPVDPTPEAAPRRKRRDAA